MWSMSTSYPIIHYNQNIGLYLVEKCCALFDSTQEYRLLCLYHFGKTSLDSDHDTEIQYWA